MHDIIKHIPQGSFAGGAYRDIGKGFPVALLHGFPLDGEAWRQQADALKDHYRLIIPDLPGSGRSPLPAGDLTIEGMADFVYAILLAEKIGSCILIGHSMGGYITLAFAEKYSQLLKGFGFVNSSATADTEEKKQARLKSVRHMEQYGAAGFVRQTIPNLFGEKFRKENEQTVVRVLAEKYASSQTAALTGYYRAMMQRPDRTAVLRQSAVPVLFIIGGADATIPPEIILQQVSLPATASIHIVEEAGHMAMLEAAEQTNLYLKDFIDYCLQIH